MHPMDVDRGYDRGGLYASSSTGIGRTAAVQALVSASLALPITIVGGNMAFSKDETR